MGGRIPHLKIALGGSGSVRRRALMVRQYHIVQARHVARHLWFNQRTKRDAALLCAALLKLVRWDVNYRSGSQFTSQTQQD